MPEPGWRPTDRESAVVVAIGPGGSDAALRWAAVEARRLGITLHLVHVVELVPTSPLLTRRAQTRASGRVMWDAVLYARSLVAGAVPVTSEQFHGSLVHGLLQASRAASVLVVQQRAGDARHAIAGVVAESTVPVVRVPGAWNGAEHLPRGSVLTLTPPV